MADPIAQPTQVDGADRPRRRCHPDHEAGIGVEMRRMRDERLHEKGGNGRQHRPRQPGQGARPIGQTDARRGENLPPASHKGTRASLHTHTAHLGNPQPDHDAGDGQQHPGDVKGGLVSPGIGDKAADERAERRATPEAHLQRP